MARLAIRILGPVEIKLNGEPVSGLESDKVRALLVFLAVARTRPHRREKMAALLWPDYPENSARANLRRALFNLRKALGDCGAAQPFLLVTRQTIQFNRNSNAWVDAIAFTELLDDSPPQSLNRSRYRQASPQAIRRLEDAVALYHGEFLEGFSLGDSQAFDEWVMFRQEQFHRRVMEALYNLGGWHENRGDWAQALHCAWQLVELDPWRESGHRQVMRLLAFSGQRSEALLQYRACCQVLDEELGVEPEEETVQLFEQIRDGKLECPTATPGLARESEIVPRLPAFLAEDQVERHVPPVFVGRERELAQLDRLLKKAIGGQGQIVFVLSGPGRGKTALLGEFARRAMDTCSDLLTASGRCRALSGVGDPYLPFRDILAMLTGDVEAQWEAGIMDLDHARRLWKALPVTVKTLLQRGSQVIPTLLSGPVLLSRAKAAAPDGTPWLCQLEDRVARQVEMQDKTRLFQQVASVLHDLAEVHPLLLILDDLQWIDTASTCLLFHLGRRLGSSRILVAGAYRPEELAANHLADSPMQSSAGAQQHHPLEKVLYEFRRRFGDVCIDLAAVNQSEARHFVDAVLDTEPNHLTENFRESLFQHTGGHPLFTIEILQAMQARGDLLLDDGGCWVEGPMLDWKALPPRVEGVIEERIARLDDGLREILAVASVEGEEFTVAVLAKVLGVDQRQLLQRLSGELEKRHRLVREGEVRTVGAQGFIRFRFAHPLFRQYLSSQIGEGQRTLLRREITGILESLYQGSPDKIAAQPDAYHT